MTTLRKAALRALEALDWYAECAMVSEKAADAASALRAALAEDMQEYASIPGTNVRVRIPPEYRDPSCVSAFNRAKPEHITDGSPCWCDPELNYVDPETGVKVWVHKEPQ